MATFQLSQSQEAKGRMITYQFSHSQWPMVGVSYVWKHKNDSLAKLSKTLSLNVVRF